MAVRLPKWLALAAFFLLPMISTVAQVVTSSLYDSAHSYREVTASADGCPTANHLCHYHPGMNGWGNSSPEKEYNYRGFNGSNVVEFMNWRMVFPPGYKWDHSVKYPMIIMLHGSGESGRIGTCCFGTYAATNVRYDNNDHHLLHGGREHQTAVGYNTTNGNPTLPVKFPGIVVWPQSSFNASWESGYNNGVLADDNRMAAKIIDWIITHYDVDPDRISMHGLSSGARGTWDLATKRPDLFASILPMSGVSNESEISTNILVTTPVWLFQGGLDTNPNPASSEILINLLNSKGGNGIRTLYPTIAHGTWFSAYAEPNFFPFILAANKKKIHVFGGDASICIGGSVRLGFSAGFTAYQWTFNGVDIPGANSRFYVARQTGAYAVRYTRVTNGSVGTSFVTNVTSKGVPCVNVPPTVNAGPDQSITLPVPQLQLAGTASDTDGTIASYLWTKVSGPAVTMTNATTSTVTLTNLLAGTYVFQLRVTDNGGAPATDQVMITVSSGGGEREYDVNLTWAWNLVGGAWNDFITTGGGVVGNSKQLSDVNGSSSGITISVSSAFVDGANNHGVTPGIYPNNAMVYFLRSTTTKQGSLKLTGLNLSNVYDLTILCSNADVWYPSDTRLTIAGQTATINARGNANQLVTFSSLTPSATGDLTLTVAPATTNATNIGVINALVIKERPLIVNVPPVVDAGPDVQVDLPLTQWQVTGTATDAGGTINLRQWTKISGPAAVVSDSGTGTLTLTNIIAGTYVFQFAGRDNSNLTSADQMTLTVNPGVITPPVVDAGADQTVMVPLSQLQLPGSVIDADGFILSQLWTKVSGPPVTMTNASTSTLTLTNIQAGTYVFQLSAQDNSLSTSTDQMTLIANVNQPPVVDAGPDVEVDLPLTEWQVTGTATDADGTINLRQWTKVSGPAASVSDSGTGTLTLTNIIAGTYVFQFAGRDNSNLTSTDQMTLTVNPGIITPPVVDAGADQTVMVPLSQLQLPGSVIDADGFILSQLWTKVSGPSVTMSNASTSTLTLTNIQAGTYVFELSAQDNSLSTSTDQMTLIANVNQPPVVDAGPDVEVDLPLTEWQVTGTATDADGTINLRQWTKVSGPAASVSDSGTGTLTLTNIIAGTYVFQFAGRDNSNLTSTDQMTLTVDQGVVIPPVVGAGTDQTVSLPLVQLQLPGSVSDTDGFILSQLWTKVSGPSVTMTNATTSTLTLSSISAGTYVFQLSAQDNSLGSASDQVTLVVNPNLPPVVNAGPDQQLNLPLAQLQLTGTATDEGSILSVLWTKISGPAVTMTNAATPTMTLTGLAVGTYVFQFAATDNGTLSANDQVTIIVSPAVITGAREFDINITWQWNQPGGSGWNDFITTGGGIVGNTKNALVDKNGNASTISIVITTAFVDGVNNHGVVPGSYPNNVMQYFLRSTQARSGALKLAGLNPSKQYDVAILSSNIDVWYASDTRLTVQGVSSTVNARSNAGTLVNFPNVVPTAAGEIPVVVAPATSTSTNIGVINAIILTEHDSPISGRFMTPEVAQAIPDDFVRLYPNAIDDHVIVEINPTHASPDHYQIEFTDMRGISIHHLELKSPDGDFISERIPAEFLQTGIYIVAVRSQQNGTRYFKVIKR